MFIVSSPVSASAPGSFKVAPKSKPGGGKWRIGYIEGGYYSDYLPVLKNTVLSLAKLGWLSGDLPCLNEANSTRATWACLSGSAKSEYVEFAGDAFKSANWDNKLRIANKEEMISRLNSKKDIDLMIAMGTWAGQDLTGNTHKTPTIVTSTSNALASGIVRSTEFSGYEHIHARMDPNRYARQVELFYGTFRFKRLGVVFEDTLEGRSYAAVDRIMKVASEKGFKVVPCNAVWSGVDQDTAAREVMACHEKLAPQIDAMYITIHRGLDEKKMYRYLTPFFKHHIPTFTMGSLDGVKRGVLMSMAQPNWDHLTDFYAMNIARILNGAKPGELSQILKDPRKVNINIRTAKLIGVIIPIELMMEANEIIEYIDDGSKN